MNAKAILAAAAMAGAVFVSSGALAQDDSAQAAEDRFAHMSQMAQMFSQTDDPAERHALMQQHRELMREQMQASGGMMMDGGMMGMHGAGGMGRQGAMSDEDMAAMTARMTMMQNMMIQMMNQQNMMMQMQGNGDDEHEHDD